jgi:hypothetical protein
MASFPYDARERLTNWVDVAVAGLLKTAYSSRPATQALPRAAGRADTGRRRARGPADCAAPGVAAARIIIAAMIGGRRMLESKRGDDGGTETRDPRVETSV